MTLKKVSLIVVISIIISNISCNNKTITVTRRDDGDKISGDIGCVDHYGTVQSEDNSCICKKGSDVYGTFFTSCLYEDTTVKTGKTSRYIELFSTSTKKNLFTLECQIFC